MRIGLALRKSVGQILVSVLVIDFLIKMAIWFFLVGI